MAGLNSTGFSKKQYSQVVDDMSTRARDLFGDEINLSVRSPLGIFIRVVSWAVAGLWQLAERVYFSGYVATAEGVSLDREARDGGVQRRPAETATVELVFTGSAGASVPIGTETTTEDEVIFETTEAGVVGDFITAQCTEAGAVGNAGAGTINALVSPVSGITGVSNPAEATGGRNIETDAELRARYFLSFAAGGASTEDAIIAELLRTEGVRAATLEDVTNVDEEVVGFNAIVLGGTAADVAQAIYDYKAAGVKTYGAESAVATGINGDTLEIFFDYATVIDVYANITITTGDAYPLDGDEQVRTAIAQYIGGTDDDLNLYAGLTMGRDVIYTKLIDVIYNIPGVEDLTLEIGTDGVSYGTSNLTINTTEVAETSAEKLVITHA